MERRCLSNLNTSLNDSGATVFGGRWRAFNGRIDITLEMMSVAPTNAGKHFTSAVACAQRQRYANNSVI